VAHIEGGDKTGNIDESVRHAVTKLSHLHFVSNEKAKQRVLRMGEKPNYVFNLGAPEIEFLQKNDYIVSQETINYWGVGDIVNIKEPYLLVIQHPVTSEVGRNRANVEETLWAVYDLQIPAIWFWPNIDAGTDEVSKGIRNFREKQNPKHIRFIKYLSPENFIGLLQRARCLVGNSSTGIKESSFLGLPVVNIGSRQQGRLRADNVLDVGYDREEIKQAVKKQLEHGSYQPSYIYYKPGTSQKMAEILATAKLYTQKSFYD
jgi:UDP-hydrolysing UDP-N-acetyl-D-glucosamine 2-epimerase